MFYNKYPWYKLQVREAIDDEGAVFYEVYDAFSDYVFEVFDFEDEANEWARDEEDYLNHGERV